MIPKDFVKKVEFNQENGELTIVFMDKSMRILTLDKNDEERGILHFK